MKNEIEERLKDRAGLKERIKTLSKELTDKEDEVQSLKSNYEDKLDKKKKDLAKSEQRLFSLENQMKSLKSERVEQDSEQEFIRDNEKNLKL